MEIFTIFGIIGLSLLPMDIKYGDSGGFFLSRYIRDEGGLIKRRK